VSPGLLTVLTFAAAALAVFGVYSVLSDLFLRDRSRVSRRVDDEFRRRQRDRIQKSSLFKNVGQLAAEAAEDEKAPGLRERFVAVVEQSGLSLTPERLVTFMAIAALTCGALVGLVRQSPLPAVAAAGVGGAAPFLFVLSRRNARLAKLMRQLPDAFDLMARVIRAGQTMSQALQAVADEFDQPIAGEFTYCYEQQNLGLPPEVALRDLARRTGLLEVKIFVLGLLVQQQSGGNLAELLDKLANVVRDRFRMRGKIRALTAEGRIQAVVLLILPVALMLILMLMSDDYARGLAMNPNMIVAMFVSEAVGAVWIRKIVNFDF
jgi:tight adherence protein B